MANSQVAMTEGSGKNAATYSISEGTTKEIQRMALNTNAGVEIGTSAAPVQVTLANTGANATAVKVDNTAALDKGSGTSGSATQRVIVDSSQLAVLGQTTASASSPVVLASDQSWPVSTAGFMKKEDVASSDGDAGIPAMVVRKATPANSSGSDGDYEFLQSSAGALWVANAASTDKTLLAERVINGGSVYETIAANVTAQVMGGAGATGDYISGILVIPANTSPGNVLLLDNAISITVFTGGATSVSNLVPFFIPLGIVSQSGAWKITTGASVSCICMGKFT